MIGENKKEIPWLFIHVKIPEVVTVLLHGSECPETHTKASIRLALLLLQLYQMYNCSESIISI